MGTPLVTRGWYGSIYSADCSPIPTSVKRYAPGYYAGHIFADNMAQAVEFAKKRNLNERVEGLFIPVRNVMAMRTRGVRWPYNPPSTQLRWRASYFEKRNRNYEFIHQVTFLSFLAARCGVLRADVGALGDGGLVHEAIHFLQHGEPSRHTLGQWLSAIEAQIPGYVPPELRTRAALGD